eukprot:TRINITY_DN7464_c0_g1_i1.p1 TRINITY_DN7464_c0_g1~~TRINITY_DN7464_c0_g1_i1.p1  ORF type:complete len:613 (+),score=119.42 TRINITY_DN7464_c0_g1_i1:91-1839(+)
MAPRELGRGDLGQQGPCLKDRALKRSLHRREWRERYLVLEGRRLYHYDCEVEAGRTAERPYGLCKGWLECVGAALAPFEEEGLHCVEVREEVGAAAPGEDPPAAPALVLGWEHAEVASKWLEALRYARRPRWLSDSDPRCTHCQESGVRFTVLRRRHHCRRCGGVFAASSMRRIALPELCYAQPERVCIPCAENRALASRFVPRVPIAQRAVKEKPLCLAAAEAFGRAAPGISGVVARQYESFASLIGFGSSKLSRSTRSGDGTHAAATRSPQHQSPQLPAGSVVAEAAGAVAAASQQRGWFSGLIPRQRDFSGWARGELLGSGSFGDVYTALLPSGEYVAVKEVRVRLRGDDKQPLQAICSEIQLMRGFDHPNICELLGAELSADARHVLIFMELIVGGSVTSIVHRFRTLPTAVLKNYTRDVFRGLQYLHERRVIHRDVKGANVLVQQVTPQGGGVAKLCDFGISTQLAAGTGTCDTLAGSPYWMAPEVFTQPQGYDSKADIWSAGCTVVEMITGRPPWPQRSAAAVIQMVASGVFPTAIPSDLPRCRRRFIERCLRRDPRERPGAEEMLSDPWLTTDAD